MRTRWFSLALCLALPACMGGSPERIENPAVELLTLDALPAPSAADFQPAGQRSFINPRDKLSIEVFGVPEMSRELTVDADGTIDYPLIGKVMVAGMSSADIGSAIETRLRGRYVRDPHVNVNVMEAAGQLVTLDGAVAQPGHYQVVGDMTLMRAIASAGGLGENASSEDVVVFRNVGGRRMAALYNLGGIRVGNYEDPALYPNDIVIVGNSPERAFFKTLTSVAPLLTAPLIVLLQ